MPAFLITTSTNTNRHQKILQLTSEIFPEETVPILATDWRQYTYAGLSPFQAKHHSLVMAYRQIAQTVLLYDVDHYIVVEDDLHVTDAIQLQETIDNLPEEPWDVCYLTRTSHNAKAAKTEPYDGYFARIVSNWWETPITAWSGEFARRFDGYIQHKLAYELWCGHIDHILLQLNRGRHFGAMYQSAIGLSSEGSELFHVKSSISE